MKISTYKLVEQNDKSGKMPVVCNLIGYAKVRYNRELDHIYINPCSGVKPKKFIPPFSWKSDYFINNIDECIKKYESLDIQELSDYYDGTCILRYKFGDNRLCSKYSYNKHIKGINNSVLTGCNLNCIMCCERREYDKREAEVYQKLLDAMLTKKMEYAGLTHVGEPFLFKEQAINFLQNCKSDEVVVLTNGTLLNHDDLDKISECMKKRKIDFSISIDGTTKETYEKIRPTANFEKVMDNIIYSRDIGLLHHINYTIQRDNLNERDVFKKFFDDLGIKVYVMIAYNPLKKENIYLPNNILNNIDKTLRL